MTATFQNGFALHQNGQLAEAEAVYRAVLQIQPQHINALHMCGVIALQRQDYAQAVAMMERAIAVAPENPMSADIYVNRGAALRGLGLFWSSPVPSCPGALHLGIFSRTRAVCPPESWLAAQCPSGISPKVLPAGSGFSRIRRESSTAA